ncbi:hypothetical protein [Rhizobium laguerreae]|uniref:hypothetical protein n=1 Tax=Rhizobium laguerreae TaxID=1076926 RepID=UPI00144151B0|nr:hypothetical protein [Rhizobium laguerreae]NKN11828.1 hypothetical protein [Rhizobium laguerreae]
MEGNSRPVGHLAERLRISLDGSSGRRNPQRKMSALDGIRTLEAGLPSGMVHALPRVPLRCRLVGRKRRTTAVKAGGPHPAIDKAISKSDKFEGFSRSFKLTIHIIQFYSNPKLSFFIKPAGAEFWFNN